MREFFTGTDVEQTAPLEKIGLLATVDPDGLPHITFINSLRITGPGTVTLGQFIRGNSKYFIQRHPKAAFFILCPRTRKTWSGKMVWTGKKDQGEELEFYRSQPLQRYNSYFPIHRVHYFDVTEAGLPAPLSLVRVGAGALAAKVLGGLCRKVEGVEALTPYGMGLFRDISALKFLAVRGDDGFPLMVPLVPCTAPDAGSLVFPVSSKIRTLTASDRDIAVFCLKQTMESVLVRGRMAEPGGFPGLNTARFRIDWVYNSMPPNAGQIYPPAALEPVTAFE